MMRLALVTVLCGATCACSFTAYGPRSKDPAVPPDCTRDAEGRIGLDALGGVIWGLVAVGGIALVIGNGGDDEAEMLTEVGLLAGIGGGALSAAHFGARAGARSATRACRAADARHAEWLRTHR